MKDSHRVAKLCAADLQVAALQKQERRQRQRAEAAEREVARLQDEVCGAREEVAQLTKAASNAQLVAAEAERTLLDQVHMQLMLQLSSRSFMAVQPAHHILHFACHLALLCGGKYHLQMSLGDCDGDAEN